MRIERIRVDAFGRLVDFDTGPEPLGGLVAVLGPNEAGKSTLFTFLTTALYGFQPASRERNPHVPWGSDEAAGRVQVSLDGGRSVDVERRLRSAPTGRLVEGGEVRDLRNHAVPWAEHVPRPVFQQVFAVTLADLAGLDEETWAGIQDKIIGSMGSSDLASARAVADALDREAREIWRPDRRGNQKLRAVQDELRNLRVRHKEALDRDRQVRALVEEREDTIVRLREVRAERREHGVEVERVRSLLPVRHQLLRISTLREQGGDPRDLRGLPPDPGAALRDLEEDRDRLARRIAALQEDAREPEAAIAGFDLRLQGLIDREDDIERFITLATKVEPDRDRATRVEGARADVRRRLDAAGDRLLAGGWSEEHRGALGSVSVALLEDRLERARNGRPDGDRGEAERAGPSRLGAGAGLLGVGASLAGAALLVLGFLTGSGAWTALGAALATAGLGLVGRWLLRGRPSREPAVDEGAAAARELVDMLGALPVRADYLDPPASALPAAVGRLQELADEDARLDVELRAVRQRIADADEAATRLTGSLGRPEPATAAALHGALDRELKEARRARDAARAGERECRRLRREQQEVRSDLDAVALRIAELGSALEALGEGDAQRGAERARLRADALRRADQLQDELERSRPELPSLVRQIEAAEEAGESWTADEGDVARRLAHVEELEEEAQRLSADARALERDAAHLRELETVDAVDGEIEALRETEARLTRERDRKWVLARLVREADRRFREEHQPDLVRRASGHLERLTGGRYDRLLVDETRDESLFHLMGPGLPAPVPLAPPISTGTLEQAYMSLRLAIVDHLDQGRERLPLFIDEAFVNWDRSRRDRALDVLAELSAERQLFVFTCHPEMAEHLAGRGGRTVRLAGPG